MKKFIFHHKRWYVRLITIANLLIPLFILCAYQNWPSFLKSEIKGDTKSGLLIAAIGAFIFLCFHLIYVRKSMKTSRYMKDYLPKEKEYYNRLFMGIMLSAISVVIMILVVTCRFFATDSKVGWYKYVIFATAGVTLIIGVISNIFIHMFESKNYFRVFHGRHKETDVKEVMENLTPPKKKAKPENKNKAKGK